MTSRFSSGIGILALALSPALSFAQAPLAPAAIGGARAHAVERPNVILILTDDQGIDKVGVYGDPNAPRTPVMDSLARRGLLFTNAYANPVCSPTRATIVTGRYSVRTGVGAVINKDNNDFHLRAEELTLPELLDLAGSGYSHAHIGKWHLNDHIGVPQMSIPPDYDAPLTFGGFAHSAGPLQNINPPDTFYDFIKEVNGVPEVSTTYAELDKVDDTLEWLTTASEPFFVYFAASLPHLPYHAPPADLHSYNLPGPYQSGVSDPVLYFNAMAESLDTVIGRMLGSLLPEVLARTLVIIVGDNGTQNFVAQPPYDQARVKGTVYQGGIHVPLIVWGGPVVNPGRVVEGLVNTTDLYATVAELATARTLDQLSSDLGLAIPFDSISLAPYIRDEVPRNRSLRPFAYAETFKNNGFGPFLEFDHAILDPTGFKLVRDRLTAAEELYDLRTDPLETTDLLQGPLNPQQLAHYTALKRRILEIAP